LPKYFEKVGSKNKLKDSRKTKHLQTFSTNEKELVTDLFPLKGKWNSEFLK
jgi:tRNA (guanine-N7-)-methyltransferase